MHCELTCSFGVNVEVVEVGNAACLLGGIVEEGKAVAAEVGPVVMHL